jgi:hypothetical protein
MINSIPTELKLDFDLKKLKFFLIGLSFTSFAVLAFPEAAKVSNTIAIINLIMISLSVYFLYQNAKNQNNIAPIVLTRAVFVQILAQLSIYIYWGFYNEAAIKRIPLILHQVAFGYLFLFILNSWLGKKYKVTFSPAAAILSANLFSWFSPRVYFFHYVLIATALLVKTFITRNVDGVERHIFNPSGFVSNIAAVTICLMQLNYIHEYVYATQMGANFLWMPHFDLVVFLASCLSLWSPNMYLVAIGSIVTMWLGEVLSVAFFNISFTTETPRGSILLGIALLMTDPATSPRSKCGQFFYGVGYAFSIFGSFIILAYNQWHMYFVKVFLLIPLNFYAYKIDRMGVWVEEKIKFNFNFSRMQLLSGYVLISVFATITLFGKRPPPFFLDFAHKLRPPVSLYQGVERADIDDILSPQRFYFISRMIVSGRTTRLKPYQSPMPLNKDFDQIKMVGIR